MKTTRRTFLQAAGASTVALGLGGAVHADDKPIQGFEKTAATDETSKGYVPISDRKLRVGLIGNGVCKFAPAFGFQDHPNVEVVAVSDLIPDRCAEMTRTCRCDKSYPSLEELVKDDRVEAVFIATDAPNHVKHVCEALKHGKHVASAVPACFGSLEQADQLYEAVTGAAKSSGLKYMMFETSYFHEDLYAMRQLYNAGAFGKVVYCEGEYFHYMPTPIDSYKGWRIGLPPQWYPTHSNAYYIGVSGGSFTEVSCVGVPSVVPHLLPQNNAYRNAFGTEIAMFRTSEGGVARMGVSWDTPGHGGEMGRLRGQKASFYNGQLDDEQVIKHLPEPPPKRPPLPSGVQPGGHGGSHGYLTHEFVSAVIQDRKPLVDVGQALNMTVAGITAHQSALRDGELMKIPQFHFQS